MSALLGLEAVVVVELGIGPKADLLPVFHQGIGQIDPETHAITLLAASPVPIGPGGDILKGQIYFGSGSHVYSYAVPD